MKKYTYSAKDGDVQEKWYVVDANGAVLGRLASAVAARLRGKHNPLFTFPCGYRRFRCRHQCRQNQADR